MRTKEEIGLSPEFKRKFFSTGGVGMHSARHEANSKGVDAKGGRVLAQRP